jgi:hypothetical protein
LVVAEELLAVTVVALVDLEGQVVAAEVLPQDNLDRVDLELLVKAILVELPMEIMFMDLAVEVEQDLQVEMGNQVGQVPEVMVSSIQTLLDHLLEFLLLHH